MNIQVLADLIDAYPNKSKLAKDADVSPRSIYNVLSGHVPNFEVAMKLFNALGMEVVLQPKVKSVFVTIFGEEHTITLKEEVYTSNNRLAIVAMENGEPVAKVTANIPDKVLNEGEFIVKSWSENVWVEQLLKEELGIFEVCYAFDTGYVTALVCRKGKNYDKYVEKKGR